jgi:phosphate transport system substrate-binding protein
VNGNGKNRCDERFYDDKDQLVRPCRRAHPSPPARVLYLVATATPSNPVVVAFLEYVLTKGQAANVPQGYIGISKDKLQKALAQLKNTKR